MENSSALQFLILYQLHMKIILFIYYIYIPRFLNLSSKYKISGYKKAFENEKPRLVGYEKYPDDVKLIDGVPSYSPSNGEYIFSSASKLRGIGNSFVVITLRLSKETGTAIYEVFNPTDVEIIEE